MAEDTVNEALINQLSNLGTETRNVNKTLETGFKALNRKYDLGLKEQRALSKAFKPITNLVGSFKTLIVGISALTKALFGANERIKISAATNIDVVKMSKKLEKSMDGVFLSNELVGEAYSQGTRHLSGRFLTLAREMKFSGENYMSLFAAFALFEGALGFNQQASERLAHNLDDTSTQYQVSTDRLVGALVKLTDTLAPLALTSGSQETMNAMTRVAGMMGPRGMDLLQPIMSQIMRAASDPAALARASAGFPGLTQFVRAMESGASAQVQAQMLESLIKQGGTRFMGNLGDISLSQRAFGTGDMLQRMAQGLQAMNNRSSLPEGISGEPATIESLLLKLVDPINKLADEIVPKALFLANDLADEWVNNLSPRIRTWFEWLDENWPEIKDGFMELKGKIFDLADAISNIINSSIFQFFFGDKKSEEEIREQIRKNTSSPGWESTYEQASSWFGDLSEETIRRKEHVKYLETHSANLEALGVSSQRTNELLEEQLKQAIERRNLLTNSSGARAQPVGGRD